MKPEVKAKCSCVHRGFKCGNEATQGNLCDYCASGQCPGNR